MGGNVTTAIYTGQLPVEARASTVSFERLIVAPRAVLGLVGLPVLAVLSPSLWRPGLLLAGAVLVATSALSHRALQRTEDMVALRSMCLRATLADALVAVAVWGLLSSTGTGAGSILLPLVAFELALKNGALGAAGGSFLVVCALAARMAVRWSVFSLPPRPGLVAVVMGVTGLLVGLAATVRAQDIAHRAALAEKQRLKDAFKEAVAAALSDAGVGRMATYRSNLEQLLEMACHRADVGPEVGRQLVQLLSPSPVLASLTKREAEVLELMACGLGDAEIAARLYVARVTVRVHASNILRKLGASSREEAIALALRSRSDAGPTGQVRSAVVA